MIINPITVTVTKDYLLHVIDSAEAHAASMEKRAGDRQTPFARSLRSEAQRIYRQTEHLAGAINVAKATNRKEG